MSASWIALIHPPQDGSEFGVTFPDFPGLVSSGRSREEALERASEALGGHLAAMRADGDALPPARDFRALRNDPEFMADIEDGAEPSRIAALEVPAPKERVNVMLARDVLRQIDRAAASKGVSRSAFIEAAAGAAAKKQSARQG